jgi:hypothetical protein
MEEEKAKHAVQGTRPNPLPPELTTEGERAHYNAPQRRGWWFIELWYENRESFKEIVYELLLFIIVIITVSVVGYAIHISPLPNLLKIILEILDGVGGILLLIRSLWHRYSNIKADAGRDAIKREAERQLLESMKRVFEKETGIIGEEVELLALGELQRIKKELGKE